MNCIIIQRLSNAMNLFKTLLTQNCDTTDYWWGSLYLINSPPSSVWYMENMEVEMSKGFWRNECCNISLPRQSAVMDVNIQAERRMRWRGESHCIFLLPQRTLLLIFFAFSLTLLAILTVMLTILRALFVVSITPLAFLRTSLAILF